MLDRTHDLYANTPTADLFLDRRKPTYLGGMLEMANARLYPSWGSLTEALRTGQPQNEAKRGGGVFAELYADPERLQAFLKAMTGISRGSAQAIRQVPLARVSDLRRCWRGRRRVVGERGLGTPTRHEHRVRSARVCPHFEAYARAYGLSDRLAFHAGDFFADPLPRADVLVMGHVLHDWDLEQKRLLIAKAYDALPQGGALVVYETLIDDAWRENAFGLLMSLNMLIETHGGFDYTAGDCMGWMRQAGFRETRVEHLAGPESMVVGVK